MKVNIVSSNVVSAVAYKYVYRLMRSQSHPVLGLATGTTPIGLYRLMIAGHIGGVSYANVSTYNLDEYVGLSADNVNSYRYFMNSHLFDHIDIDKGNTHVPCGLGQLDSQCSEYDQLLASTTVHLQILGIGNNGHIAFNEPNTPWDSTTHIVELSSSTIDANARLFENKADVPRQAITMGLSNIMCAEKILVLAIGSAKAQAVYDMVHGDIDTACPASILRNHPDVVLICDHDAGALL